MSENTLDKKPTINYFTNNVNIIELTIKSDFRILRLYEKIWHDDKVWPTNYLKKVIFDYKGMFVTDRFTELKYTRNYLDAFSKHSVSPEEPNPFFRLQTETSDKKKVYRLQCKFDETRFIYKVEARTMVEGFLAAMQGYSDRFYNYGKNTIEALYYVETVLENSVPKLDISTEIYVQNELQKIGVIEGLPNV
jgi:hypothetical protein